MASERSSVAKVDDYEAALAEIDELRSQLDKMVVDYLNAQWELTRAETKLRNVDAECERLREEIKRLQYKVLGQPDTTSVIEKVTKHSGHFHYLGSVVPLAFGQWAWQCSCTAVGSGYLTKESAAKGFESHLEWRQANGL